MAAPDPDLQARAAGFDAAWLSGRRWFRGKARGLEEVRAEDAVRLSPTAWLVVLLARHGDGGEGRYLVPAVEGQDGRLSEPRDGDGAWLAFVRAVLQGAELAGRDGAFRFRATSALAELLPGGEEELGTLDERRLDVEQSNTSVRLGSRLILKLYRLLEPGTNPEVEVNLFLTEVGFRYAPAVGGWGAWTPGDGEGASVALLQALVPSRGDGWDWALSRLTSPPQGPVEAVAGAAQIGGITAEMHAALASRPERGAFGVAAADAGELRAWRAGANAQLDAAIEALSGADRERLEAVASAIRDRFAQVEDAPGARTTRIHGDYHLGQLLRTEAGFMVIDFEGEPARPMAERRRPASPLRDVAGMLRSFDYAARTAERRGPDGFTPDGWLADARSAFLGAYGALGPSDEGLLAAFEAEKACYELGYEANNRPDWTWLPLGALERLAS